MQLQEKKRLTSEKQLPHFKRRLQRQRSNRKWHNRQATLRATQTFFSEQKLFKQHGTIKACLDAQRQQHQFYNKMEYFSDRPGPQQQKQAVPLVPHRKTLFS